MLPPPLGPSVVAGSSFVEVWILQPILVLLWVVVHLVVHSSSIEAQAVFLFYLSRKN